MSSLKTFLLGVMQAQLSLHESNTPVHDIHFKLPPQVPSSCKGSLEFRCRKVVDDHLEKGGADFYTELNMKNHRATIEVWDKWRTGQIAVQYPDYILPNRRFGAARLSTDLVIGEAKCHKAYRTTLYITNFNKLREALDDTDQLDGYLGWLAAGWTRAVVYWIAQLDGDKNWQHTHWCVLFHKQTDAEEFHDWLLKTCPSLVHRPALPPTPS